MIINYHFENLQGPYIIYSMTDEKGNLIGFMLIGPDGPVNPSVGPNDLPLILEKAKNLYRAWLEKKVQQRRKPPAQQPAQQPTEDPSPTDFPGM